MSELTRKRPERVYEVKDDGSVVVKETQNVELRMDGREFVTYYREHLKELEKHQETLSEAFVERANQNIEDLKQLIEDMKVFVNESEDKTRVHYEQLKNDSQLDFVKEQLPNEALAQQVVNAFNNLPKIYQDKLSNEERSRLVVLKKKLERKSK